MIDRIIGFSLNQRYLILVLLVGVTLAGVWSWLNLKIEAYPDVADTEVAIITTFPGRPAEEVEQMITVPLERELNAVPNVIARRSKTIFGLSIIRLTFDEGVDDYFARQRVLERIATTKLPEAAETELGPLSTPVGEILRYIVESDGSQDAMALRDAQDWIVTPALLKARGVADVTNFGGLLRQYQIILHASSLDRHHLTVQDVLDAVVSNNASTGGGVIHFGASMMAIRSTGRIQGKEDIERIVVTVHDGVPVLVRDLATVEIGAKAPAGLFGYRLSDGKDVDDGVEGIVLMRRGENPSEVLVGVKKVIEELNAGGLPDGVKIRVVYDRKDLVDSTLDTVGHTLFEGVSIVVIVLIFFLGNFRAALAVAITIPLSLLFAFVLMKVTGIPANLLSLGAIDFGIIVDASVVMIEAIARHLHGSAHHLEGGGENGDRLPHVVARAAGEVQRQVVFAVAIIIFAYLPLFTLQRVEGKLFSPMAFTLTYAIGGSLLLAIVAVPVFSTFLFRKGFHEWRNPVLERIQGFYSGLIERIVDRPWPFIYTAGGLVVAVMAASYFVGSEFLPELDEGGFNIRCILPAGVSLDSARAYPPILREEIGRHPEVKVILTQLGRNDDGTDPYGPNRIEALVQLHPYNTWASGKTKKDLLFEIKAGLEARIPGAGFSFSQPILDNVTEAVTGSAADLAVLLNGRDLIQLRAVGEQVLDVLRSVRGASESAIEQEGPQTQLVIEVDRNALARYGINVSEINRIVEMALGGSAFSVLYEGERRYDIALRFSREERDSLEAVRNMVLLTKSGMRVPLASVAAVRMVQGQTIITREDGRRQLAVRTNIRGRDQGSYVEEARERVARSVSLPADVDIRWGGQYENLSRARSRLMIVIPITVAIIYAILFLLFDRNARFAGITLLNVPFALVGGVLALLIRGINFSVSAGVGFVSLFGVAVMSGVLLISYINYLRFEEMVPLRQAVVQGARTQLRPVLMMMVVALIGLIPAAMANGVGSDIQRPLASVIVGGLVSALVLTLVAMPAIYYVFERREEERRRK